VEATNTASLLLCRTASANPNNRQFSRPRLVLRMQSLVVAAKVGTIRKGFAAEVAAIVATGGQVDVAMLLPVVVGSKGLAAQVAGVGTLIGVNQHMPLQLHHLRTQCTFM
jgi:hypothetical protein